jgi:hypothetical protein
VETYYQFGPASWVQLTFAFQFFDPARADESFVNAGFRLMLKL